MGKGPGPGLDSSDERYHKYLSGQPYRSFNVNQWHGSLGCARCLYGLVFTGSGVRREFGMDGRDVINSNIKKKKNYCILI